MRSPIRVIVAGPDGRMGRVMTTGLDQEADLQVVGGLRRSDLPRRHDLFRQADVLVDFTHMDSAPDLLLAAIEAGVRPVSGTTGLTEAHLTSIDTAARQRGIGAIWAPSFQLGHALLRHLAIVAAPYFDHVEVVEGHHATKADAPSGVTMSLVGALRANRGVDFGDHPAEREVVPGARGGVDGGIRVHSVRLPGVLGWHEVVFSGAADLLRIRHDEVSREAYVAPVAHAVRRVVRDDLVGLLRADPLGEATTATAADKP